MSVTRARRISRLFVEALAKPSDERETFLSSLSPGTRTEVHALLVAEERMGDFLEAPALERLDPAGRGPRGLDPGGLDPSGRDAGELEPDARVGEYTIVRKLGAGGTGIVYEAVQARPRRRVALKVLRLPLERFPEEAEILARLEHPGIAHVYAAGVHERRPYFAMEYVEDARTIVEFARALGPGARVELVARVCDAVHHGHQKGIIHRDLKPANVLVDAAGRPKVIDFGIARSTDQAARGIEGTPPYMAPEQFQEHADVRSDVWALGVLLHEVLTGRLPFDLRALSLADAERTIRETELAPLGRAWRGDLEAIARRALAKAPEERYASAAELAADLRRHLGRWPVEARRPTLVYQLGRFASRQRVAFLALAGLVLVSAVAAVIGVRLSIEKERERRAAELQAYVANIAAASAALRANDVAEARHRLAETPPALRGWEWGHLAARLDGSLSTVSVGPLHHAVLDAEHGRAYLRSRANELQVRDLADGRELCSAGLDDAVRVSPALAPDGSWLACGRTDGGVEILDAATLATIARFLDPPQSPRHLAWGAGFLATAADRGPVQLWSVPAGEPLATLGDERTEVRSLAVAAELVAFGTVDGEVELWEANGTRRHRLSGHDQRVGVVAFGPDGSLLSASSDGTTRLWDPRSGALRCTLSRGDEPISCAAFDRAGARVLTGRLDGGLTIWDARAGVEIVTLAGHAARIVATAEGPGGEILSLAEDGELKRWNPALQPGTAVLGRYRDIVRDVAISPDGRWLASACFDATVKVHDLAMGVEVAVLEGHTERVQSVAFDSAGARLVSGSADGTARIWAAGTWELLERIELGQAVLDASFAPDGRLLALGTWEPAVVLWDLDERRAVRTIPEGRWAWEVAFSPDGARIAVPGGDAEGELETLELWDVASGELVWRTTRPATGPIPRHAVARFDAACRVLFTSRWNGDVEARDVASGRLLATYAGLRGTVYALALAPDGSRLAAAGERVVQLWDTETARPVLDLRGHKHSVCGLAWSPDGELLASGGGSYDATKDGSVRLWARTPWGARAIR